MSFNGPPRPTAAKERPRTSDEAQEDKPDSVQDFYELNAALKEIGTAEMYEKYVQAVFPNSNFKEVVYRGTGDREDMVSAAGSNQTVATGAIFFTSNESAADMYRQNTVRRYGGEGQVHLARLNLQRPFAVKALGRFRDLVVLDKFVKERENVHILDTEEFLENVDHYETYIDPLYEFSHENTVEEFNKVFSRHLSAEDWNLIKSYKEQQASNIAGMDAYLRENYEGIEVAESGDNLGALKFDQIAVFGEDQIHLLGSATDLERFKRYVAFNQLRS